MQPSTLGERNMATNTATSSANGIITLVLGLVAVGLVLLVLTGRDVPIVVALPLFDVQLPLIADTRSAVLSLAVIMLIKIGLMGVKRFIA
jgi:hypothetical protein